MTIASTSNRISYTGNGVTLSFAVAFPFHAQADLVVLSTVILTGVQTTKLLTTHYTISGTVDALGHYSNGGSVEMLVAPASTERITIYRDPARTQGLDLVENNRLPAESVEAVFDYQTMLIQRVADLIVRSVRQPDGDNVNIAVLPSSVARANMFAAYDALGDPIAAAGTSANLGPVSAFIDTLLPAIDAAAARATLGITVTSNKDDEFRITGSADTTKKIAFEADGITSGTTRTYTGQDLSGTLALIPTVASYTGTATLEAGVGFARLSGASFTLTLPPIATLTNRPVTIKHLGTSLSQVYTIKGNVADNIIAADGTANTYLLYTNGEEATFVPDGTSWYVTHHIAKTNWVDVGPMLINATTSGPTKPTTPDIDKMYWRRDGNRMFIRYILQISSAAGSAAGTGTYIFSLPTNIAFDTTILTPVVSTLATALRSEASAAYLSGTGTVLSDSSSMALVQFYAYDPFRFQALIVGIVDGGASGQSGPIGSAQYALTNNESAYNFELNARAANWRL